MFTYSNPAITFSRDTDSIPRRSERQDKYSYHSTAQYSKRRSRDAIAREENGDFAALMRIRQAVSVAATDYTQRRSAVLDPPTNRSRPSSQSRSQDRLSSTESQVSGLPEASMLGNDLRKSRISASHSHQRSRSTDSSDSFSSGMRSLYSAVSALPRSGTPVPEQTENNPAAYKRSTDRYNSRRNRPYASYYTTETSTCSDYDVGSQAGSWDSPPLSESTRSYHSAHGTPEPTTYGDIVQFKDGNHTFYTDDTESDHFSRKTSHHSRSEHSHKHTLSANMDDTIYISRTPSLTSTQNSPPSTPSSYSDSSFVIADYSIDDDQPSTSSHTHHPPQQQLSEQANPPALYQTTDESSTIRHFSKPRRFFRTKANARSRTNSDADHSVLLISTPEPAGDHHELISPPISPLTPSITLPILHFSTTDAQSNSTSKAPASIMAARSCSLYVNTTFSAGLSFGIPAPELGIRLASLETMAERQAILIGRRSNLVQ